MKSFKITLDYVYITTQVSLFAYAMITVLQS